MREMTARQREVLAFIRSFTERNGAPPTVREIGERFGFTARAAFDHLKALERKGMLKRRVADRRVSRLLVLAQRGGPASTPTPRDIPILGRIAAGAPVFADENREGSLPVQPEWFSAKGGDLFALKVRGESMISAHIMDGDVVVVRRQETAQAGDIVAALLDNEATVKRFARDGQAVVLRPEHPTMKPIVVRPGRGDFRILGKVIGLVRDF